MLMHWPLLRQTGVEEAAAAWHSSVSFWQCEPSQPGRHVHEYAPLDWTAQAPPLAHGLETQLSTCSQSWPVGQSGRSSQKHQISQLINELLNICLTTIARLIKLSGFSNGKF